MANKPQTLPDALAEIRSTADLAVECNHRYSNLAAPVALALARFANDVLVGPWADSDKDLILAVRSARKNLISDLGLKRRPAADKNKNDC